VQRLHDGTSCTREIPQQANEHKRVLLEMGDDHRQWTSDVSRRISILATSLPLKKAARHANSARYLWRTLRSASAPGTDVLIGQHRSLARRTRDTTGWL